MTDRVFGILDGALVAVVVLGLAIWQLVSVTRELRRDRAERAADSPERPGHAVGEHRLDDR